MSTGPTESQPASPTARPRRRRLLLLALAAVAVGVAGGWWLRTGGPAPPAVPEGVGADVGAAISAARGEVVADRTSAAAWGRLGLVFTAHGFDDRAADCYREAHRLDPTDDRWAYMLGLYNLHDGRDPAAAVGQLEAALACRHRTTAREGAIRLRLAELYLAERRLGDAERLFREHLERDPLDPRCRLGLGVTLLHAGRPAEAVESLKGATASPLTARQATTTLAAAARLIGDQDGAARYEQQAARLPEDLAPPDPFAADAAAARVDRQDGYEQVAALEQAGRLRETVPLLTRMAEDPADVRAAVTLGQTLSLLGELDAAERYLRAACARDPAHVRAALLLGTVLFDLARKETADGDRRTRLYRESADTCRRAVELKPDLAMAHFCRGKATQGLGDLPAAIPHFRRAVECRPEVPQFHLGLLQALADSGLTEEAAARLPAAERVIPADHPELILVRKRLGGGGKPDSQSKS
ncbi:MAG: Tetratricopeptide 2 repeat protein [Gemmataceae bacterium]|nr:Tetratricopeptide 2 repeat protein [Gemmataceae bacterium]